MTTLATRLRELGDLEGFDVQVFDTGTLVDTKQNGFAKYAFEKKAKSSATVAEWKSGRFAKTWPGYTCKVLYGNGEEAQGNAKLATVRESYEE